MVGYIRCYEYDLGMGVGWGLRMDHVSSMGVEIKEGPRSVCGKQSYE